MKHVELTFFFFPKVNEMISYEQSKKEKRQTTITILCVWLVNNKMIQKKKNRCSVTFFFLMNFSNQNQMKK